MSSRSWMPMYWADFMADTAHMSASETGAYMMLIGHYWTTGKPLQDDDRRLARVARMTPDEWAESREALLEHFDLEDGTWKHGRIEAELAEADQKYRKRAEAGRKGGKAKAKPEQCESNAKAGLNQPQPQPHITEPIGSGADCVAPCGGGNASTEDDATDALKTRIFGPAREWLGQQAKITDKQVRGLLGRWCSRYGDGRTLEALNAAAKNAPLDPVPYIERILRQGGQPHAGSRHQDRDPADDGARILHALGIGAGGLEPERGCAEPPDGGEVVDGVFRRVAGAGAC